MDDAEQEAPTSPLDILAQAGSNRVLGRSPTSDTGNFPTRIPGRFTTGDRENTHSVSYQNRNDPFIHDSPSNNATMGRFSQDPVGIPRMGGVSYDS